MPASMISAVTGSNASVSGSRTATPVVEPRPGSTPMTVPSRTPTKHQPTFSGVSAVSNPSMRLSSISSAPSPSPPPGSGTPSSSTKTTCTTATDTAVTTMAAAPAGARPTTEMNSTSAPNGEQEPAQRHQQRSAPSMATTTVHSWRTRSRSVAAEDVGAVVRRRPIGVLRRPAAESFARRAPRAGRWCGARRAAASAGRQLDQREHDHARPDGERAGARADRAVLVAQPVAERGDDRGSRPQRRGGRTRGPRRVPRSWPVAGTRSLLDGLLRRCRCSARGTSVNSSPVSDVSCSRPDSTQSW